MPTTDDIDRVASVLADATVLSDRAVAEKYGIHRNTVINYRKKLETDDVLRQAYAEKLKLIKSADTWESAVPDAIKAGIQAMLECFEQLDRKRPESLEAITKGLSALTEIRISLDMMINDLNAREDGKKGQVTPQVDSRIPARRFHVTAATA